MRSPCPPRHTPRSTRASSPSSRTFLRSGSSTPSTSRCTPWPTGTCWASRRSPGSTSSRTAPPTGGSLPQRSPATASTLRSRPSRRRPRARPTCRATSCSPSTPRPPPSVTGVCSTCSATPTGSSWGRSPGTPGWRTTTCCSTQSTTCGPSECGSRSTTPVTEGGGRGVDGEHDVARQVGRALVRLLDGRDLKVDAVAGERCGSEPPVGGAVRLDVEPGERLDAQQVPVGQGVHRLVDGVELPLRKNVLDEGDEALVDLGVCRGGQGDRIPHLGGEPMH